MPAGRSGDTDLTVGGWSESDFTQSPTAGVSYAEIPKPRVAVKFERLERLIASATTLRFPSHASSKFVDTLFTTP